ncbi:MAG: carbohydrate ABC transporter permease [Halanaerobium sp.]
MMMKLSPKTKRSLFGFMLVLPALTAFAIFVYRPLIETFILSFHEWNMVGEKTYVGFNNYLELFESSSFRQALLNTFYYGILLIIFVVVVPIFINAGLYNMQEKAQNFYKTTLFTPAIISLGIAAIIWSWIFNPISGLLGAIWKYFGLDPINWLSSTKYALFAMVIIVVWKAFGYNFLLILAGLVSIPDSIVDSARVDGASGFKLWYYIMLPLMAPTILFVLVFTLSMSAEYVFTPIHVLTGGGPMNASTNLMFEIWRQAFKWFRVGTSSAVAVIIFLIFSFLMLLRTLVKRIDSL